MKKARFLLLSCSVITVTIFSLIGYSYGQIESPKPLFSPDQEIFIFVQTIVENSNGQIVTYLTSEKFTDLNYDTLYTLLGTEASEDDPIVNIYGKNYQVINRKLEINYHKENVIASTLLGYSPEGTTHIAARFAHDGYPILKGEKVISIWTFLRPID